VTTNELLDVKGIIIYIYVIHQILNMYQTNTNASVINK